jgi:hypothetical protein
MVFLLYIYAEYFNSGGILAFPEVGKLVWIYLRGELTAISLIINGCELNQSPLIYPDSAL